MVGSTNAFLTWFSEWGQVVYFIAQIIFWAAIATAALLYALQYKRLVSHKVGDAPKQAKADRSIAEAPAE